MTSDDSRLYAKLALDFADSPKIAPLSDKAFRQYIETLLWSTRIMTDGFIPERMVKKLLDDNSLAELTTNDPAKPSIAHVDGGYQIHDFSKHQNTREKIDKKREAGRLGGLAKARNSAIVARAKELPKQNPSGPLAIQITDTDIDVDGGVVAKKPRQRASRIPSPFIVTKEMREWAKKSLPGVNVDLSTEQFVDYWRAAPNGTKLDWVATWRNWLRRDYQNQPQVKYQKPPVPDKLVTDASFYCKTHGYPVNDCPRCEEEKGDTNE